MIQIEVFAAVLLALGSLLILRAVMASDTQEASKPKAQQQIRPRSNYRRAA